MITDKKTEFLAWVQGAYGEQLADICEQLWLDDKADEDAILVQAMNQFATQQWGHIKIAESKFESD